MIPRVKHPNSDTMLALWEAPGDLASTVEATLGTLRAITDNPEVSSTGQYYATSCMALIHYRLTKTPSRDRLYTLLDTLHHVIQCPLFLTPEHWPIPLALKASVETQCHQHLSDIDKGLYHLINIRGKRIVWDAGVWSKSEGSDLDFAKAYQHLAALLSCDLKTLVKFARDAKGQRLGHFLLDQLKMTLEPHDGPTASDRGQTHSLKMDRRYGLILCIECPAVIINLSEKTGMRPRLCPVGVSVNFKPGFLEPTMMGDGIQYSGDPTLCAIFTDFMAGKPTTLERLFAFPIPITLDAILALIETYFSDPKDKAIHTALTTHLRHEISVIATSPIRDDVAETRYRADLRMTLQNILARFPSHLNQDLFLNAIYDPFHPENVGKHFGLGFGLTALPFDEPDDSLATRGTSALDTSLTLQFKMNHVPDPPKGGAGAGASPPTTPRRSSPIQTPETFHSPASAASVILEDWQTPPIIPSSPPRSAKTTPTAPPGSPWRDRLPVYHALAASEGRRRTLSTPERSSLHK